MIYEEIMERFVLEPRCDCWKGSKWLVIKDLRTGKIITEEGKRNHMTFSNSRDAYCWIINNLYRR